VADKIITSLYSDNVHLHRVIGAILPECGRRQVTAAFLRSMPPGS
jgi:hypothetical protein